MRSLTTADDTFRIELDDRQVVADQVVVATGPFHEPRIPEVAAQLAPEVFQLHSSGYRRPGDVPEGRVLVVGGGNSGFQIAKELSASHAVELAVGSRQTPLPQRVLGRDLFWWLTKLGAADEDSRLPDRKARPRPRHAHRLKPPGAETASWRNAEATRSPASGRTVTFADGTEQEFNAVIWATGYRPDHSWIHIPVLHTDGGLRHRRGVTDVPGLYFLGLSWQHTRGSALLGWVKDDAEFIATKIDAAAPAHAAAAADRPQTVAPHTPPATGTPERSNS